MKLPKINFKLGRNCKISAKSIYRTIIILLIIATILIIFILGKILFESINSSARIVILKSEIAPEAFDINDFEKILKEMDQKTNPSEKTDWSEIKNIFLENKYFIEPAEIMDIEINEFDETDEMNEFKEIKPL